MKTGSRCTFAPALRAGGLGADEWGSAASHYCGVESEAGAPADILTAQFSSDAKIHLLERNDIDRVYREQALSAGNRDF